jgi:hypothetical protein
LGSAIWRLWLPIVAGLAVLAGPSPAHAAADTGLELSVGTQVSYRAGEPVTLDVTVTNRGPDACALVGRADGGLEVLGVTRDGDPVAPTWGRRIYLDGYAPAMEAATTTVPAGGTVRFTVPVAADAALASVVADLANSALLGRWSLAGAGAYEIRLRYTPAAVVGACAGSSNEATVRLSRADGEQPMSWALLAGAAAGVLVVVGLLVWWLARRRRGRAGTAAAVALLLLVAAGGAGVLGERPAWADIDLVGPVSPEIQGALNDCLKVIRANDQAGILDYLEGPSAPPVHIRIVDDMYKMNTDGDEHNPNADVTIAWQPERRGGYHHDGLLYDPCSGLAHEMSHAYDYAHNMAGDNKKQCGNTAVDIGQTRAIIIENVIRAAEGKDLRHYSGADRVADDMARCNDNRGQTNRPAGFYGACGGGARLDGGGCGRTTGDPHLTTFDLRPYDLQSVGEFVLARGEGGDLEIQTRQAAVPGSRVVAVNAAVAARVGATRLEFVMSRSGVVVRRDGAPVTLAAGETTLPGGVVTARPGATPASGDVGYSVTWPDGTVLWVDRIASVGLSVMVLPAASRAGTLSGLLGNANGDPADDLVDAAGALPTDALYDRVHGAFADRWRVTDTTSLFTYAAGESTATYTDRGFPAGPATAPPDADRARQVCAGLGLAGTALADCILDVSLTGNTAFAVAAVAASRMSSPPPAGPAASPGPTAAPTSAAVIVSGATLRDGAAVHGRVAAAGQSDRYPLDLAGADTFYVTGWQGPAGGCDQAFSVNLVGVSANNYPCQGGTVPFHVPDPGRPYELEIAGVGTYSFDLVTMKVRTSTATLGATVTGRLDARGRVDRITFDGAGAPAIRLADLPATCPDPLTYVIRNADTGETVQGGRQLCATPGPVTLPLPTARYTIEISSDALHTGDYGFRLDRATP